MALVTASGYPQSVGLSEQKNLWFYFSFLARSLKARHPHFGQEIHSQTWRIPLITCYFSICFLLGFDFTFPFTLALRARQRLVLPQHYMLPRWYRCILIHRSSPLAPAPAAWVHLWCHQPVAATKLACPCHKPCTSLMAKKRLPNASLFLKPMSPSFFFSPNTDCFSFRLQNLCFCFEQMNFLCLERGFFV